MTSTTSHDEDLHTPIDLVESGIPMGLYALSPQQSRLKRYLPRSLLGRSLLILITPLVLLQLISAWIFYDRHWSTVTRRLAQGVAGDVATVVELMLERPESEGRDQIFDLARQTMWLRLGFEPAAQLPKNRVSRTGSILEYRLDQALRERLVFPFSIDTRSHDEFVDIYVQMLDGVLSVRVTDRRLFSSTTYIFIMWMVGSSIVLFGIATIFMRNQVRPIRRLAYAAESFGKGRDVPGFKPEGATEVRQAAAAFLKMRERIKRQISQRTEMLAGVSHDLRTPLTRMKLQLALLSDDEETTDLKDDVQEMERMIEGYLAFARGEGTERPAPTELDRLLREVVERARREYADPDSRREPRSIDLHIEEPVTLPLRRESMRRCLHNLLSNALRHGHHIAVRAGHREQAYEITIDDDGPGIPPEQREEVFRPFYRLDSSRNPETGGTGLGLTIARDAVRRHGGELTLDSSPSGGLRARIRLPV